MTSPGSTRSDAISYAEAVTEVIREWFRHQTGPVTAKIITEAIERQARDPQPSFEVIVGNPNLANWRLKACSEDRRKVRLHCYRMTMRDSDVELQHAVNDALSALKVSL